MGKPVNVNGRSMIIRRSGALVDCRDLRTGYESQAIIEPELAEQETISDSQVRDAVRSAYYNATSRESGKYPVGGDILPDDFEILAADNPQGDLEQPEAGS